MKHAHICYLFRCSYRGTFGFRAGKALDISVSNLNGEVLGHTVVTVDVVANLEI